jgi:hypothetical protein
MLFGGLFQPVTATTSDGFVLTQRQRAGPCADGVLIPLDDPQTATIDIWINAGSYHYYYPTREAGTGYYGHFETSSGGIDFFICDQENFDLWTSGYSASVYERHPSAGSADWDFIIPTTGTWYFMYDNTDDWLYQKHVTGYHRIDRTAPVINLNLDDGDTCSGITEITITATDATFSVSYITLDVDGVLMQSSYGTTLNYDWNTQDFEDGQHTISVFTSDNVGNIDAIGISVTVSNVNFAALGILGLGGVALVAVVLVLASRRRTDGPVPIHPTEPVYSGPHPTEKQPEAIEQERPAVMEKPTMTFCPFCGSPRDPPDANFCKNCGGKLGG